MPLGQTPCHARRGTLFVCAILLLSLLGVDDADAQRRRRRRTIEPPAVVLDEGSGRSATGQPQLDSNSNDPLAFLFDWQRALAKRMPSALAWALLAAPFWLPLLIWLLVRMSRRRPRDDDDKADEVALKSRAALPRLGELATPSVPELNLDDDHRALLRADRQVSLYETFLALGGGPEPIRAWRATARDELTPELWSGFVAGEHGELRARLRARWLKRLARERVLAWMLEHPLVGGERLEVGLPDDLEVATLNELGLIGADGLGVSPDGLQEELIRRVRRALTLSYRGADNPFALQLIARRAEMPALLLGAEEAAELPETHPLTVLLCGLHALDRANTSGLVDQRGQSLQSCMDRHLEQGHPRVLGEGLATYALLPLPGPEPDAMGPALACVAGAAFSPATVALEISRQLPSMSTSALEALGRLAAVALANPDQPPGRTLLLKLRAQLGEEVLRSELGMTRGLEQALGREIGRSPLWPASRAGSPELALIGLHRRRLEHALYELEACYARLTQVLAKVAYAGQTRRDQRIAAQRLGFVLAGFGPQNFVEIEGLRKAATAACATLYEPPHKSLPSPGTALPAAL